MDTTMRILHTADWHLGAMLYDEKRLPQFQAMLDYLHGLIMEEKIDVLLVSGDIFDTVNPPNSAQEQYYSFLAGLKETGCRSVVVIAGNHDSPSLLEAPKEVLKTMNVHVVTHPDPKEEIIAAGEAVILAVPYLRESDISTWIEGGTSEDQQESFRRHVRDHYAALSAEAPSALPQIFMGHCYIGGSRIYDGEEERQYVGNLGVLESDVFPPSAAYVALGHIHSPQKVNGNPAIRYSGSPLPISFNEWNQTKEVEVITVEDGKTTIVSHPLPPFCNLKRIKGNIDTLETKLQELKDTDAWIEAIYTGNERIPNLSWRLEEMIKGGNAKLLRVFDQGLHEEMLQSDASVDLSTLTPKQVFKMRLDQEKELDAEKRKTLEGLFDEILKELEVGHENL
jgi:exonuclease SbcD